jgi:hypothetical protein
MLVELDCPIQSMIVLFGQIALFPLCAERGESLPWIPAPEVASTGRNVVVRENRQIRAPSPNGQLPVYVVKRCRDEILAIAGHSS